jgi:sodium pump decarboxylase gamma subunit
MKKVFIIFFTAILVAGQSMAQVLIAPETRTIEGYVGEITDDQDTLELNSARVSILGSAKYVQTDASGNFSLEVPDSTVTLRVELFGYGNTEIEVADNTDAVVVMLDRHEGFMEDEGWLITVVGMSVVFGALILLFTLFKFLMPMLLGRTTKRKVEHSEAGIPAANMREGEMSGEVASAISAAIHLYFDELHDEESGILTIEKTVKSYSPWSSKIYVNYKMLRGSGR